MFPTWRWQPWKVQLHLSRDSVAAGDDVDSHDRNLNVARRQKLSDLVQTLVHDGYLPSIIGGRATWVVRAGEGGKVLAVVAAQWVRPELVVGPHTRVGAVGASLYFRYLTQRDPQTVLAQIRSARSDAELEMALARFARA